MKLVLGIDIGTTAIKAAVFDEKGMMLESHTCEYDLLTPSSAIVELDAQTYVDAFKTALGEVVNSKNLNKKDIVALGLSAQGETLFFLDENNKSLRNAIVWMDNRAVAEAEWLEEKLGKAHVHKTTGQVGMAATWPASKILWVKNNEPQVYEKVAKYLLIEDYFIYLLTGKYVSEDSLLCSTMYWDINTRKYWSEMLDLLGINESQLPEIHQPGAAISKVTKEAAEFFGLDENILICLGGLDQACGAIGVGNVKPGIFSESTGAALASVAMTNAPVFDPNGEMPCFASAIPGMYMIHAYSTGGMAIRWYRDTFCAAEMELERLGGGNAYTFIDHQVKSIPVGSDGLRVIPHLQGSGPPDTDCLAKGVFLNVTLAHNKGHFARAIMEGVTMVLCRMVESTIGLGAPVSEIRALSGGAKSTAWCQIKADATGIPLRTMQRTGSAACLGAAILAGVSAGVWKDVVETASQFAEYDQEYLPVKENKAIYDAMLEEYKLLLKELAPAFNRSA